MLKSLILFFLLSTSLLAAVTGEDDRISFSDLEQINPATMAKATATQLSRRYLSGSEQALTYPTGKLYNQCPGEKFQRELTLGGCSGFLIGENILVAAGHCKDYQANGCADDAWLFNHFSKASDKKQKIKKSNLYYCKKVLDFKHDMEGDYVVMELDRKVPGVTPLEMDFLDKGRKGDPVAVLGYPLGRSFTYTPGGRVLSKDKNYLRVDSDAFKNNSGSALVNLRTGKVEGVLTNARKGMSQNSLDGCQLAKRYDQNIVLVNRLSRIPHLQKTHFFQEEIKRHELINNCKEDLKLVLKYREKQNNDWVTILETLPRGEKINLSNLKSNELHLNATLLNGKSFIKGSDFWGFTDSSRQEELGFKKIKLGSSNQLCP